MKLKRFNETKEDKDQELKFDANDLVDNTEPIFITDIEDQEKTEKEFKKAMDKIVKFESFIKK